MGRMLMGELRATDIETNRRIKLFVAIIFDVQVCDESFDLNKIGNMNQKIEPVGRGERKGKSSPGIHSPLY